VKWNKCDSAIFTVKKPLEVSVRESPGLLRIELLLQDSGRRNIAIKQIMFLRKWEKM
jgi:hypothetical protein